MGAAVVIKRRQAGQRGGLFAVEAGELGQADQQGQGSALADAGNAEDEVEAGFEVVVAFEGELQAAQFSLAAALQTRDLAGGEAAQARRAQMFEAGLQARDILLDLLDKGQVIGERGQPGVGFAGRPEDRL